MTRLSFGLSALAAAAAFAAAGCGADRAGQPAAQAGTTRCPASLHHDWQQLANRIKAPVYCPSWMPDPLHGQLTGNPNFGGAGGVSVSVSPDKSYLASFVWAEPGRS